MCFLTKKDDNRFMRHRQKQCIKRAVENSSYQFLTGRCLKFNGSFYFQRSTGWWINLDIRICQCGCEQFFLCNPDGIQKCLNKSHAAKKRGQNLAYRKKQSKEINKISQLLLKGE